MNYLLNTFLPIAILILPIVIFIISYVKKGSAKHALIHLMYSGLVAFVIAGTLTTKSDTQTIDNKYIEVTKTKHRVIVEYKADLLKTFEEKKYYDLISKECVYKITTDYNVFNYVISRSIKISCYEEEINQINL